MSAAHKQAYFMFSTLTFNRMKHYNPFHNFINSGQSQKAGSEYWQEKKSSVSSDIGLKGVLKLLCSSFTEDEIFKALERYDISLDILF